MAVLTKVARSKIAGRVYLERGEPVTVLCGWGPGGGPRNVLIRRADGSEVVRPFRGLRRTPVDLPGSEGISPARVMPS